MNFLRLTLPVRFLSFSQEGRMRKKIMCIPPSMVNGMDGGISPANYWILTAATPEAVSMSRRNCFRLAAVTIRLTIFHLALFAS